MPALILFHRRTIFGGDDLQPTSILTIVVRVVQITLLCIPILHYTISHLVQIIQHDQSSDDDEEYNDNEDSSWLQLIVDRLFFAITTSTFSSPVSTAVSNEMPSLKDMNESRHYIISRRRNT